MNCEVYQDLVAAYVDGVLSPTERQEVEHHLDACAPCRLLFTEQSRFQAAFTAWRLIVPVPAEAEQRLRTALVAEDSLVRSFWERFTAFFSFPRLAFGVVAAGLLLVFLFPRLFPSPLEMTEFTLAVDYYQAAIAGQMPLDYQIHDPQKLETAFNHSGKLDFATHVLDLRPAGYHIRGGHIAGGKEHPIAVVLYRGEDEPIVCLRQRGMAPPMPASGRGLKGKYLYMHAGYTLSFIQKEDHFCILISRLSREAFQRRLAMVPAA